MRFNPALSVAAICIVGVAACANPAADGLRQTHQDVQAARDYCVDVPQPTPGHEAPYYDCLRDAVAGSPDATIVREAAQQAKYAEDYDAGRIDQGTFDLAMANLRESDQNIYSQRATAAAVTSSSNATSVAAGLLAAGGLALDIFTMVNW
jgi:hypothetical protein